MLRDYLRQGLVVLVFLGGAWWLSPVWGEYSRTREKLAEAQQRQVELAAHNDELRQRISMLQQDSREIERVARDKFGYCRERETVYDFSEALAAPARP